MPPFSVRIAQYEMNWLSSAVKYGFIKLRKCHNFLISLIFESEDYNYIFSQFEIINPTDNKFLCSTK